MNSRRNFLKQIGLLSGAVIISDRILANPYDPVPLPKINRRLIRVRGNISDSADPVKGVVVSDGISASATDRDGNYELITDNRQDFIFISLPSGYKIPVNEAGTANFYKPISHPNSSDLQADFVLEKSNDDINHEFLLLADPQTLDMDDMNRFNSETIDEISHLFNKRSNTFAVSCGDIMYDNLDLFPEYEKAVSKTGIPFFQVLGNHDVDRLNRTDETSHLTFHKYFGPRYYSYNRGEIHYVILDDIFWYGRYLGYFDQTQLDWLKKDLSFVEKGKTVVVFCHIPPNNFNSERNEITSGTERVKVVNRELLYDILGEYKSYIISGHMHESEFIEEGGTQIHICGAVCGAWWTDNICYDGTPNGYMVYSAKGCELSWIYKSTGKDFNYQMKSYLNTSEHNPVDLIINIWGMNNLEHVYWYENGIKKGKPERYTGFDPLAEKLFGGKDKPSRHKWIDPTKTDHLFRIRNLSLESNLTIEYIDGFGRNYYEKL